ncbi:MAG: carboxypeptidase-like regulatory domain-containing protein, partial [Candidatus Solibacter sp.]|nr:carboxypeptidase-like regulatory domain-containing protein [Candidatus Solibacter sp.]
MTVQSRNASHHAASLFAAAMVCVLAFTLAAPAQTFYGSILGTVTDASGAVVPGATVSLTNSGT